MAIVNGSRYETSTVDYFRKVEFGTTYPIVFYKFDDLSNITFVLHTFNQGENLQSLAMTYFRRPDLWWTIAEYNPEVTDFFNITPGTVLRIPNV